MLEHHDFIYSGYQLTIPTYLAALLIAIPVWAAGCQSIHALPTKVPLMLFDLNFSTLARRLAAGWQRYLGSSKLRRVRRFGRTIERLETRQMLTTFTVSTFDDVVSGSDNKLSLREAVTAANTTPGADTIQFASNLDGTFALSLGQLNITDSVSIIGHGSENTIIDAQNTSRVFRLTTAAHLVTFDGVTIAGGRTKITDGNPEGAAIRSSSDGTISILNSQITGNTTTQSGGTGGAIFSNGPANLVIANSTISGNSATASNSYGGAIGGTGGGALTLTNSTLTGNSTAGDSSCGGAIYWRDGQVNIIDSTVSYNSTLGNGSPGGGIFVQTAEVTLTRSVLFVDTTAGEDSDGGGLYSGGGAVTLIDSIVAYCGTEGANSSGGGINAPSSAITITHSSVYYNSTHGISSGGGAISTDSGSVNVVNSPLFGNSTSGETSPGGAISTAGGGATVAISMSTMSGNSTSGMGSSGGALAMQTGSATITQSEIKDNSITGTRAPFSVLTFGGGALFMGNGALTITSSTISGNDANGSGGGLLVRAGTLDVINSTISGNSSHAPYSSGGGLATYSATATFTNSTVAFNSATGPNSSGGGIFSVTGRTTLNNSIVAENTNPLSPDIQPGDLQLARPARASRHSPLNNFLIVRTSLIGDNLGSDLAASATPDAQGNLIGTHSQPIDPLLGPLQVNGDPASTPTHALASNSLAVNRGSNLLAQNAGLTLDQAGQDRFLGDAVDMGAFEVQAPSVQEIRRADGAANPTSASSVRFDVIFTEDVIGVAASQFTATTSGTVQTGSLTVTRVDDSHYTVLITAITGLGEVGLRFQNDGTVRSKTSNIELTPNDFTSSDTFTIQEGPSLAVQAIEFAPGASSPTTATTVSFKVTFSAAVMNVAASQFQAIFGGSVASGNLQLTGSGKDYTVTISGITGGGTLGLNFQDDGTIRRVSDNLPMTQSTFTGAVYTIVQGNQGSADLNVGGLQFHVLGGGTFTTAGSLNSFTGQVQVGFTPTGGNTLVPLVTLNGTISVDASALSFSATGAVTAVLGGTNRTLFSSGISNVNITQLITQKVTSGGGSNLSVAGSTFTLNSFGFTSSPTPAITLQGTAVLPKGITIAVTGNNFVQINSSGINLSGASFALTNSFSIAGTTFSTDQLTANYNANGNVFSLTGTAAVTVRDIGNLNVNFSNTGLVISNGVFSSLDVTVNGAFAVKGVQIAATNLHFQFSESTQQFSMSGTASVTIGGFDTSLSVTFGNQATPGLVVTNGELISLDMTVNSQFKVSKVAINATNLELTYSAASRTFTLIGSAGIAISGLDDNLSVTFGNGNTPGLVISNGSLVSLDVTVNAQFHVARVTFKAANLRFTYEATTKTFSMSGTAGIAISGVDNSLSVTFGQGGRPGLVVSDGALVSLDVTVNAKFNVKKVEITATDLRFTYIAANSTFTLTGTAGIAIAGIDDSLSVTFGHSGTPGLVVTNGALVSLDITVNATFNVKKVTITAWDLEFTYVAATGQFTLTGTAGITIAGVDDNLFVTFGHNGSPGLVVTDGALVSLDITINSQFNIKKVTITATDLRFTYVAATSQFTLSGTAGIQIYGVDDKLSVTFGHGNVPGLVITNGSLVSLDVTVNAVFHVQRVTITATNLEFTYTASTSTFTLSGTAGISVGNLGADLSITFGHGQDPGLIITDGALEKLDMSVNAGFRVASVLQVNVVDLRFTYTRSTNRFTLSGGVTVSPVGLSSLANISASIGTASDPGIVIQNGNLISLHLSINANISVSALTVSGQLSIDYTQSTQTVLISGRGSIAVAGIGSLNVNLGGQGTAGIVIVRGQLTRFDMTIDTHIRLAGLELNGNLIMNYSSSTDVFVMTGSVGLNIGSIGNVTANLGGGGSRGLVISHGQLTNLDMGVNANFSVGPLSLTGSFVISYQQSPSRFIMYGSGNGSLLGQSLFTASFGDFNNPGLDIRNGQLNQLNVGLSGSFRILGIPVGHASLTASYNASRGEFYFQGQAGIDLPSFIPDWLCSLLGGRTIASMTITMDVIANNNHDSYFQAEATIGGLDLGFKKQFDGTLTFIGNQFLSSVLNGAVTVVNAVADGVVAGWNWLCSLFGPLDGAFVYYDPGFNFDFANDPRAVTGPDGRYLSVVPAGATAGQLVVTGGVDRSTGLTNALRLTAPYNAIVVSPLTSLLNQCMQERGLSAADAMLVVSQSLGLPATTNLLAQSFVPEATGGDLQSARSFSREVQVGTIVHQVSSLLSGMPGAPSVAELSTYGFAALASIIGESGGAPLDLSDSSLIRDVIDRTAALAGLTLDANAAAGAATIIAGVNGAINDLPLNSTTTYLNRLLQIQTVAQGTIVPQLAKVTSGQLSIATVVSNNTGAALTAQVNSATFGPLNVIGPTISITPIVAQPVGAGDPSAFEFQVFLSSPTPLTVPVSVNFATISQTATLAHGDFDQSTGTLTWLPGDVAPKTVTVHVHATNSDTPNRLFTVELTNPLHAEAEIVNTVGIGSIISSDFATTTALAASSANTPFGQAVTFTANVSNLDPLHTIADQGTVTFYDGDQFLGSTLVSNGIATFSTSGLTAGVHAIKAAYSGNRLSAENYIPSVSSDVREVVDQVNQSITFPSLTNVTLGIAPFVIDGTASSGLPLNFRVISGSATVIGNVLSAVGPGTVVLEAAQPGDENFTSATPVTRTFLILDSGTGSNDTAPVAQNNTKKIAPGAGFHGQLIATDADNDALTYAVYDQPSHGTVVVNDDGTYDYTGDSGFVGTDSFTFYANDTQLISNIGTISITLGDPNRPPEVSVATFSIAENSAVGGIVGTVTAGDPDFGQSVTFTITNGNTGGAFAINPTTGKITIASASALNFEINPVFTLTVQASDNGAPVQSGTGLITINLTNVNEAPVLTTATFGIPENSAAGVAVGTLTAVDPDVGQTKAYSITAGNSNGAFAINPTTGAITVANPLVLDFETLPSFSLTVKVADNGSPVLSNTGTITIILQNANEAPVVSAATFEIAENSAVNSAVGTVTANDPDFGQSKSFTITAGNTGNAFAIDPATGVITVATPAAINFATNPTFSLAVKVTDNGNPALFGSATTTINVTRSNQAPILVENSNSQAFLAKLKQPVNAFPTITVNDPNGATDLASLTVSVSLPAGKKKFDVISSSGFVSLGTVTGSFASGRLTVTLNAGVTSSQVETFLRSIRFSTKGASLKTTSRNFQVSVTDKGGMTSNVINRTVGVRKK
jgi:hypothetical protein